MELDVMNRAMAKLAGIALPEGLCFDNTPMVGVIGRMSDGTLISCPNYVGSHDACQPFIDRMTDSELDKYIRELSLIIHRNLVRSVRATAAHKAEGILKTHDLWEVEA